MIEFVFYELQFYVNKNMPFHLKKWWSWNFKKYDFEKHFLLI